MTPPVEQFPANRSHSSPKNNQSSAHDPPFLSARDLRSIRRSASARTRRCTQPPLHEDETPNANSASIRAPLPTISSTAQPVRLVISTGSPVSTSALEEHAHCSTEQPVSNSLAFDARPPSILDDTDTLPVRLLPPLLRLPSSDPVLAEQIPWLRRRTHWTMRWITLDTRATTPSTDPR